MVPSNAASDKHAATSFVDRSKEMSVLEKALDLAQCCKGNMVLLRGEAGIGKSRIVSELTAIAQKRGFQSLNGSCLEYRKAPYQPFKEMLMDHFEVDLGRPYGENLAKISALIDSDYPGLREHKGLLVDFFYPMDEPMGGYRTVPDELSMTIDSLRKKGFRVIYLGDPERLKARMVPLEGLEHIGFGNGPDSINPRRLEKLAKYVNDMFRSFSHSAIILGDLDSLISFHNPERIRKFIRITDTLSMSNGGIIAYLDMPSVSEILKEERSFSEHISKDHQTVSRHDEDVGRPTLSIIDLISRLYKEMSQKRPLLTVIEDLHWGDKPTFNLLQYIARNITDQKHLIVGTFREENLIADGTTGSIPLRESLQRFTREHLYEEINLGPLDEGSVAKIISELLDDEAPADLVSDVFCDSEGNPFFVIELMKLRMDPSEKTSTTLDKGHQSAKSLVMRRLDILDVRDRRVLQQASVLDQHASMEMIMRTQSMGTEELLDSVDHLISLKFLREKDEQITFEHSKVREITYELIPPEERRTMHLSAARSLEETLQTDSPNYLGYLSYHYLRGGESRRALELMMQMTEGPRGTLAAESILDQMVMGIGSIEDETGDRSFTEFKAKVFMRIGDLLESLEHLGESAKYYQKVVNLCEMEGLHLYLSSAYRRLGDLMLRFFRWDHTVDYYLRSLHLAKRNEDTVEIAQVFRGLGRMYYLKGDYSRAIECFLKFLDVPSHTKGRPYLQGMLGLGDIYNDMGDFNQALVYYKMAIRTSEEYDLRTDVPIAYTRMAGVLLRFNEPSEAERMVEWAYTLAKDLNKPHLTREVAIDFAEIMLEMGNIKRAEECLQEFSYQGAPLEDKLVEAIYRRALGTLYSKLRDNERAAENIEQSVSLLESIQVPHQLGRAYLEQALARFQCMDIRGAIDFVQRSNGIFKGLRSVYYQNRTASKLRELKFINEGMK